MIDRLGFAYQYQHLNNSDWQSTIFSDEKCFTIDNFGEVWVHRPIGKRHDSPYVVSKRKSGRFSVGKMIF